MKKLAQIIVPLCIIVPFVTGCNKDVSLSPKTEHTVETIGISKEAKSIEELCNDYFKANANDRVHAEKIISVTNEFMAINKNAKEFNHKKPVHIQPIHAYGIDGVAYYEVWFTEDNHTVKGWILISATDKDYPLVNFSQGIPYSSRLITAANKNSKVYRFGVSYYALEKDGQKVADYGRMPGYVANSEVENGDSGEGSSEDTDNKKAVVEAKEGVDYFKVDNYETLKNLFATHYYSNLRANTARTMSQSIFPKSGHGEAVTKATRDYQYRWVGGTQCYYTQIAAGTSSNSTACWSGCNNNAWTNIYGWWDRNRSKGNLIPTTSLGETSPIYRNTSDRQRAIDPVQMYIRSISNTYCGDGTGWTKWSDTYRGYQYAGARGYGYNYQYRWCNSAGCHVDLANILTDGVANNYTPVYIGANAHAYVGYGWAQWTDNTEWTWAYCYPGWSENNNDDVWISWHDFNAAVRILVY